MKIRLLLATGLAFFFFKTVTSQCAMYPVSLDQRISNSELIVEGTIIDQHGFRSETDEHIYTANTVQITKIFKGSVSNATVVVISEGGQVGDEGETVTPSLFVRKNISGMFFLKQGRITFDETPESYEVYSGPQGCIYYDLLSQSANDVFEKYPSIETVYEKVAKATGIDFIVKGELPSRVTSQEAAPVLTGIGPRNLSAGTNSVITIHGTGFGNTKGSGTVEFKNASSGPTWIEPYPQDYKTWSDTLLEIVIPSDAGTGGVRVTQSGGAIINEAHILFSHLNIDRTDFGSPTVHINENGSGGFTWQMSNGFNSNSDARNTFIRAMQNWTNHSCINWDNGSATSTDGDTQDGINNVRFAESNELSSGVLAHTRNYWKYCTISFAYSSEIDLSYDPDIIWNYGSGSPLPSQYDFESVSVHELGHAHNLGHVIDEGDFMHYAIGPGSSKRDFNNSNVIAGNHTMALNVIARPCGPSPMIMKLGCTPAVGVANYHLSEEGMSYPNPFSYSLSIPVSSEVKEVRIYDIHGRQVTQLFPEYGKETVRWSPSAGIVGGLYLIIKETSTGQATEKVLYRP